MSENLSIDEIIKKAESIKKEAEKQLRAAEKSLDEKAKVAIEEVTVDAKSVLKDVIEDSKDDDVKEFVLNKKSPKRSFKTKKYDTVEIDIKEDDLSKTKNINSLSDSDDKTKQIDIFEKEDAYVSDKSDTNIVPDIKKAKKIPFKRKAEQREEDFKTKPVTFSSNPKFDAKSDLQEIPTIVAGDHLFKNADEYEEEIGVQISFDGFDDKIESVPTIDEELAEQILQERRKEKVGKFRLFGPDETDKELNDHNVVKEDYYSIDEKSEFISSLYGKKYAVQIKIILTLVLGLPLILMTIFKDEAYFPAFLSGHIPYFATALVLYILIITVNFNSIIHGLSLKNPVNYDFPIAVSAIAVLVHTVILTINEDLWIDNGVLLAVSASFGLFMSQIGKRQMLIRIIDNFEFLTDGSDKYTVENIVNTVDAEIISRGFIDSAPLIKTSVKTDFPTNFLEISCKNEPADKLSKVLGPIMLLLSIILFVAVGLMDNFNIAFNVFMCSICISLPLSSLYITNSVLRDVSASLSKYSSRVCGYEGAVMACGANAMVMEAADLFDKGSCDLHGIKTFNGAKVDDAIINAAAVIIQTKSPLASVFDDVIIGKQSILPKVEGVTYEDKMGTSAWIYKRKVLVGNRDLLIRHGISVPKESFEKKHTRKGRKALYLAIAGKVIAMFVVSYSADADLKRELKKLEKSGITIIVKSSDPYINETSIAQLFSLPEGFIRVMNSSSARVFDKYSDMNVEKSPAYVIHNGTAAGFVSAMRSAGIIVSAKKLVSFLVSFGSAIGFAAVALLSAIGAYNQLSAINIMLFQIIWSIFMLLISKLRELAVL